SRQIDAEVRRRMHSGEPLYTVHHDLIRDLKPDLILTQTHCEVCAITPAGIELPIPTHSLQAHDLASILDSIQAVASKLDNRIPTLTRGAIAPDVSPGTISRERYDWDSLLGLEERGRELVAAERLKLKKIEESVFDLFPPSVTVIEWADPLFSSGNW